MGMLTSSKESYLLIPVTEKRNQYMSGNGSAALQLYENQASLWLVTHHTMATIMNKGNPKAVTRLVSITFNMLPHMTILLIWQWI